MGPNSAPSVCGPLLPPPPPYQREGGGPCRQPSFLSSRHTRISVRGCSSLEACHQACPGMVNVLPRKDVSSTSRTYASLGLAQHRWRKWPRPVPDGLSSEDEKICGLLMSGCWPWRTSVLGLRTGSAQGTLSSCNQLDDSNPRVLLLPSSATPLVTLPL